MAISSHCACSHDYYIGVIQQLLGPNVTQFWPPTRLEWTIVDILHTTYPLFPSVTFLLATYPTLHVYVVIEWPLGLRQRYIRTRQAEVLITYSHKQNFSWWCIKIMAVRVVELPVTIGYEIITQTCELGGRYRCPKI